MPKIIDNIREKLLMEAKKQLMEILNILIYVYISLS